MRLDDEALGQVRDLIDERVARVEINRVEFEEIKVAIRDLQIAVSHLEAQVAELAAAQRRTDAQIAELATAQRATDQRLAELAARTDRRFDEMGQAMREMRESMGEMRASMGEMRESMSEMRQAVCELAQAQQRSDERADRRFAQLHRDVGALTEAYGLDLEDVGGYVVPHYLRHEEGLDVGPLERHHIGVDGCEYEVDLYGEATTADGQTRTVLAEVKSRVHVREVEALIERNAALARIEARPIVAVLFPRRIHPEALALAREAGMLVIPWDYQYRRLA